MSDSGGNAVVISDLEALGRRLVYPVSRCTVEDAGCSHWVGADAQDIVDVVIAELREVGEREQASREAGMDRREGAAAGLRAALEPYRGVPEHHVVVFSTHYDVEMSPVSLADLRALAGERPVEASPAVDAAAVRARTLAEVERELDVWEPGNTLARTILRRLAASAAPSEEAPRG